MQKAEKFDYQDLIKELQLVSGYSYHRIRMIVKTLSQQLQYKFSQGYPIECKNICKVDFNVTGYVILDSQYYTVEQQAKDVSELLELEYISVLNIVNNYYDLIKNKIEQGFQVNIKSVCYITPVLQGNNIYLKSRISPQLKKPEIAEFVVMDNKVVLSKIFEKQDLRLSLVLNSNLNIPRNVFKQDSYEPEYIDFKNL